MSSLDEEEEERRRRDDRVDMATEGGCCLIEFFAVASCFALLALFPLLAR